MSTAYDLYGTRDLTLLSAKNYVEETFGISLEERDSLYYGGIYYVWSGENSESFILKVNLDPFDDEPVEQNFPDYPVLLYIDATARSSSLEEIIKMSDCLKLLRHEVF